ncbi:MAG: aspartate/glutamate racemase family protein [Woeseiaceae bacterium]
MSDQIDNNKIVGVLGGMGPGATVDFMATVVALTPADKDQDHVHMIVDNDPTIPPRQDAILHDGPDPGPAIATMAKRLQNAGADFLVMPCNTAHAFSSYVTGAVDIPLLSIIDVTVAACKAYASVGLMATEGCLRSNLYQEALTDAGIDSVLPTDTELAEFMRLTFQIKSGDRSTETSAAMQSLAAAMSSRGALAIIAGCTEIPLVLDAHMLDVPLISSTDLLAKATVELANQE